MYIKNLQNQLSTICKDIKIRVKRYNCAKSTQSIKYTLIQIEHKENIYSHLFSINQIKLKKRSLFDGIGEASTFLFGTLSTSDALEYNNHIKTLDDNSKITSKLINSHTMIIKSLYNTLNHTISNNNENLNS